MPYTGNGPHTPADGLPNTPVCLRAIGTRFLSPGELFFVPEARYESLMWEFDPYGCRWRCMAGKYDYERTYKESAMASKDSGGD